MLLDDTQVGFSRSLFRSRKQRQAKNRNKVCVCSFRFVFYIRSHQLVSVGRRPAGYKNAQASDLNFME